MLAVTARRTDARPTAGTAPARRVTQPQRRLRPDGLAALDRARRRQLCQVLLTEGGARVVEFHGPAGYDELVLQATPLWRPRTVRVRIAAAAVTQRDLDRLAARARDGGDADAMLIAPLGIEGTADPPPGVMLVDAMELIARLERSALVAWPEREPTPAFDRMHALRGLEQDAALLDPVGLRWLPVAALNELPVELSGRDLAPQDLLERLAFRLLSGTLRFGGQRHGEAARGQRLPDSVITWRKDGQSLAALVDCKASADGYTMAADHLLRFVRYVGDVHDTLVADGHELRHVVVLSSEFPGRAGAAHPFHGRARELHEQADVALAYVRAVDLARLAVAVEARELTPARRETLDWAGAFARGLVCADDLQAMLGEEG